ncbi:hypothetical protein AX774_g2555 [Zancudomyces culisetae]|uniref:Uncharacterized protein n=1 Tax=Zancudomyces culisetae TaxID=1213189 RepID=A0A1R1PSL0_ZANCU|nr:hypothetical protein AX774_g2555 [Zancudomyces culisetae]|eukprot:OMH83934.1 hypothetical protein AX774_g2555 [Zancudomyces culisetae]
MAFAHHEVTGLSFRLYFSQGKRFAGITWFIVVVQVVPCSSNDIPSSILGPPLIYLMNHVWRTILHVAFWLNVFKLAILR